MVEKRWDVAVYVALCIANSDFACPSQVPPLPAEALAQAFGAPTVKASSLSAKPCEFQGPACTEYRSSSMHLVVLRTRRLAGWSLRFRILQRRSWEIGEL